MRVSYSTAQAAPAARKWFWERAVARTYFPLELGFRSAPGFSGELDVWSVGNVSISRNVSDGMIYRRHERHLLNETEESYLITVPESSEVAFAQEGKEVRCRPGAFLVERSHLPYDFSYAEAVRYLHQLFESQGATVCGWLRHQRLLMCDEALRDRLNRKSISEIAYQWGFGDQGQFGRHYRAHFGCTPSDAREAARSGAVGGTPGTIITPAG